MNCIFIVRAENNAPGQSAAEGIWTDEAKARGIWEAFDGRYYECVDLEYWEFRQGKAECVRVVSKDRYGKVTEHE